MNADLASKGKIIWKFNLLIHCCERGQEWDCFGIFFLTNQRQKLNEMLLKCICLALFVGHASFFDIFQESVSVFDLKLLLSKLHGISRS